MGPADKKESMLEDLGNEPLSSGIEVMSGEHREITPADVEMMDTALMTSQGFNLLDRKEQAGKLHCMMQLVDPDPGVLSTNALTDICACSIPLLFRPLLDDAAQAKIHVLMDGYDRLCDEQEDDWDGSLNDDVADWLMDPSQKYTIMSFYFLERFHDALLNQRVVLDRRLVRTKATVRMLDMGVEDQLDWVSKTVKINNAFVHRSKTERLDLLERMIGLLVDDDKIFTEDVAFDDLVGSLWSEGTAGPDGEELPLVSVTHGTAEELQADYYRLLTDGVNDDVLEGWLEDHWMDVLDAAIRQHLVFGGLWPSRDYLADLVEELLEYGGGSGTDNMDSKSGDDGLHSDPDAEGLPSDGSHGSGEADAHEDHKASDGGKTPMVADGGRRISFADDDWPGVPEDGSSWRTLGVKSL